jgi:hypothetical protein
MNNSVCGVGDTDFCALCVTEPFSATGRTNGPVARGTRLPISGRGLEGRVCTALGGHWVGMDSAMGGEQT